MILKNFSRLLILFFITASTFASEKKTMTFRCQELLDKKKFLQEKKLRLERLKERNELVLGSAKPHEESLKKKTQLLDDQIRLQLLKHQDEQESLEEELIRGGCPPML